MGPPLRVRLLVSLARTRAALTRALLGLLERLLPAFSLSGACALADALGTVLWIADRRGRSVGMQNLEAVFGASKGRRERRRILRASYRNAARSELLLFHLQPLPPARFRRLVRVDPDDLARYRRWTETGSSAVFVSAHFGNWELLCQGRASYDFAPSFAYLIEPTGSRELDATLERLRDSGRPGSVQRKRGALALKQALSQGKIVSLMMDRNLWGAFGGLYTPFLGLTARTTPLGAVLARAFGVPLCVILLLPEGPLRWRLWITPDLMPPSSADAEEDVRIGLTRANDLLSAAILRQPEAYLWILKRFKSRPSEDQGRYPAYSVHDPLP